MIVVAAWVAISITSAAVLVVVAVAFTIYTLVDVLLTERSRVRAFPKPLWALGVVVLPDETPPQPSGEGHIPQFGVLCPICIASHLASLAVLPGAAADVQAGVNAPPL